MNGRTPLLRPGTCAACKAPIRWCVTAQGSWTQLSAKQVDASLPATLAIVAGTDGRAIAAQANPLFDPPGTVYYQSHSATCPDAAKHSKGKR